MSTVLCNKTAVLTKGCGAEGGGGDFGNESCTVDFQTYWIQEMLKALI